MELSIKQNKLRKILIIEDEIDMAMLIKWHMQSCNYESIIINNGKTGLETANQGEFDLIILDLQLPTLGGHEICTRLRQNKINTPVLMLTCRSSEMDKIKGFENGADDYMTKPFSTLELIARVKALLRRTERKPLQSDIKIGAIKIKTNSREVKLNDKHIKLTAKEFDLLTHFVKNPGRVYSRTQLLDQIWGSNSDCYEHTINSHVNRLRAKIENTPSDPKYIKTVWGIGYKFELDKNHHGYSADQ